MLILMKKLSGMFMPALNKNSGMVEKNREYCRISKREKLYISVIALLFTSMQLTGQENTKYGVGILGNYSDAAEMTTALLPSYHSASVKLRNTTTERREPAVLFAASTSSSFAVGATAGTADVTATGGANYLISIEVPKGIAGLEPSVTLNYNSQAGYGLPGYGWTLGASSAITRCGKTYYYDNAAEAPQLSGADNLTMDGQRLILVSGSNLVSGAKYKMEYDPFSDIAFKTVGSYMGFVVRTKDGSSREYGSTANSNIETSGGATLLWLLSKITDKNGNTITYEYEEVSGNGEFYPTKIQYAENRSVQFSSDIRNYYFPYFGDFNGDSKTDVLCQNIQNGNYDDVRILFSTGKGFVKQIISNADIRARVFVGNFNRDGKSDIFHMENLNGTMRMKVGLFNGTGFTTSYYSTFLSFSDFNVPYEYDKFLFQVADFDGDGRSEFCNARYVDMYIVHSFTDSRTLFAKTITDGLGVSTTFDYAPITSGSAGANTGNSVSFPVAGHLYPLYVVTGMTQSAGDFYDYTYYRYKNPRMHVQGKGFMGFGEIESGNYYRDRKTVTKYGYNSSYYYPYIVEQKVTTHSGANISLSVYENSYVYRGSKRITPYIGKQTNTDYLTNTVTTVECKETDAMGNPKKIETKYGDDATETITYGYFNSTTDNLWICGVPLSTEKKNVRTTGTWTERQTIEYNSRYLPKTVIKYTNDGTKTISEETFLYDAFGNVTTHSSKAFSSQEVLTAQYEYLSGIYLTKVTDPLSLTTITDYNSSGCVQSVRDHRNNATTYEYDGMGRLIKTNYPDGAVSSTAISWSGAVANSVYCVTEQTTGKPVLKTYFDAFGRELRSSTTRYDGSEMHYDRKYDNAGRLSKKSMPFKGTSASLWNTYSYDSYGRMTSENHASGKTTSYSYSGRNRTVTEDGIATTRYYDVQGNLTSVSDPAGTITYNLRPDGQPSSIIAPGSVTTSFHYDMYGRRETIVDPSAGNRSFGYDAAGNINRETDAGGRVKSMTYDAYNRLTRKEMPELTTTYEYNADGLLKSKASTNGTLTVCEYDNLLRPDYVQDNSPDGKWLRRKYTYSGGNVETVQYLSQSGTVGTETRLYGNGHLKEIKLGSASIWKLNEENGFGQPKSVATGPVSRNYSYNDCGVPTGRTATTSAGGTFRNFSCNFDMAKGNLNDRKDNTRNIQESFTYDNLNRLKTFAGKNMEYDIKGNILQKSDAGTALQYNTPGKPYAVSGISVGTNTAIPVRNQSVTYTSFVRPLSVSEGGYTATFTYNGDGGRVKMQLTNGGSAVLTRYYLGDAYEIDGGTSGAKERLYLSGDAYTALPFM